MQNNKDEDNYKTIHSKRREPCKQSHGYIICITKDTKYQYTTPLSLPPPLKGTVSNDTILINARYLISSHHMISVEEMALAWTF